MHRRVYRPVLRPVYPPANRPAYPRIHRRNTRPVFHERLLAFLFFLILLGLTPLIQFVRWLYS